MVRGSASTLMFFAVVLACVFTAMFYAFNAGVGLGEDLLFHSQGLHDVNYKLTLAHLWLEEIITGDKTVQRNDVVTLLQDAQETADGLLRYAETAGDDGDRAGVENVIRGISQLVDLAERRLTDPSASGIGTEIDQEFDSAFSSVTIITGRLDQAFSGRMQNEIARFKQVRTIVIVLIGLLLVFAAAFLWRYLKDSAASRRAVQESEFKFRSIVNSSPLGMLMYRLEKDDRLVLAGANPAADEILGIELGPHVGKTIQEVFPPLAETEIPGRYREAARSGKLWHWDEIDYQYEEVRGAYDVYAFQTSPNNMVAAFLDITDQRKAAIDLERLNDELVNKKTELEQLLYVATHDLRSPLVNIQGFGREVEQSFIELKKAIGESPSRENERITSIINDDMGESLGFIRVSIDKMDNLLGGLLRLSRLGRANPIIAPIDMNGVISQCLETFQYVVAEHNISLTVDELVPCYGDANQLGQVFSNLIDNAIKYRNVEQTATIHISSRHDGRGMAVYSVQDNGKGIAQEHHKRIFDIFHRLEPDASEGEGLGLTIIRRILDGHRGRIKVESSLGKGARFDVYLPSGKT